MTLGSWWGGDGAAVGSEVEGSIACLLFCGDRVSIDGMVTQSGWYGGSGKVWLAVGSIKCSDRGSDPGHCYGTAFQFCGLVLLWLVRSNSWVRWWLAVLVMNLAAVVVWVLWGVGGAISVLVGLLVVMTAWHHGECEGTGRGGVVRGSLWVMVVGGAEFGLGSPMAVVWQY